MVEKFVEFHPQAAVELDQTTEWYSQRSPSAGVRFLDEVDRGLRSISEAPNRWPVGSYGTRSFLLRRFPYVVVYRELLHTIQIVAVAHAKRCPGYWARRL